MESFPYYAYLIRFWPTRRGGVASCRVSLEKVADGKRQNFPDLESLFVFLRTQVEEWGMPGPISHDPQEQDEQYVGELRVQ